MDKTAHIELYRSFIIEKLPEPLSPASAHVQVYDNYVPDTRFRLRQIRDPYSNSWNRLFQQRIRVDFDGLVQIKIVEMHLSEAEFAFLETSPGTEIRKNRYFHEYDGHEFTFDVYLGPLLGLGIAKLAFESHKKAEDFEPPPFCFAEITPEPFFDGFNLSMSDFDDVRAKLRDILDNGIPENLQGSGSPD